MNPVHLITDSTADLSRQYYDENNIICLPYTYIIDGQPYSDVPGRTDLTAYYPVHPAGGFAFHHQH